jgi:hypothetical protein
MYENAAAVCITTHRAQTLLICRERTMRIGAVAFEKTLKEEALLQIDV